MALEESQGGLELSVEDYKYFTNLLKTIGCTERRINEIISEYHEYITPRVVECLRKGEKSIYDYIAPKGAFHDL